MWRNGYWHKASRCSAAELRDACPGRSRTDCLRANEVTRHYGAPPSWNMVRRDGMGRNGLNTGLQTQTPGAI